MVNFITGTNPVLYILMRSDLTSLNAGKAMAQASHASNAMVHKIKHSGPVPSKHIKQLFNKWEGETKQGFGTCLVLDVGSEEHMVDVINAFQTYQKNVGVKNAEYVSGIILDTTYPVMDGYITHYIAVHTCAYVFMDKNHEGLSQILEHLPLYK